MESEALSDVAGVPIFLKLESEQPTGAFKLRGAWNYLGCIPEQRLQTGIITYSSGNHGQAVAFAAGKKGVRAVIVMPETAPRWKVNGVRRWGGEVVFAGVTSAAREAKAREMAAELGLEVIPPYNHADIIAGQGTVGLEIVQQLGEVQHVVVPVGGGGLIAGVTVAVSALKPAADIVGVEPDGAPSLRDALRAGQVVTLAEAHSVADGLLPLAIGDIPLKHVLGKVSSVTVSDDAIKSAARWFLESHGIVVEPSGAATIAALRSRALQLSGPTALVVSGGNVDPAVIRSYPR